MLCGLRARGAQAWESVRSLSFSRRRAAGERTARPTALLGPGSQRAAVLGLCRPLPASGTFAFSPFQVDHDL